MLLPDPWLFSPQGGGSGYWRTTGPQRGVTSSSLYLSFSVCLSVCLSLFSGHCMALHGTRPAHSGLCHPLSSLSIPRAVVLAYNLPGSDDLVLSRDAIVGIYDGSVLWWNDSRIARDNRHRDTGETGRGDPVQPNGCQLDPGTGSGGRDWACDSVRGVKVNSDLTDGKSKMQLTSVGIGAH